MVCHRLIFLRLTMSTFYILLSDHCLSFFLLCILYEWCTTFVQINYNRNLTKGHIMKSCSQVLRHLMAPAAARGTHKKPKLLWTGGSPKLLKIQLQSHQKTKRERMLWNICILMKSWSAKSPSIKTAKHLSSEWRSKFEQGRERRIKHSNLHSGGRDIGHNDIMSDGGLTKCFTKESTKGLYVNSWGKWRSHKVCTPPYTIPASLFKMSLLEGLWKVQKKKKIINLVWCWSKDTEKDIQIPKEVVTREIKALFTLRQNLKFSGHTKNVG